MNKFNLDDALKSLGNENKDRTVPEFFSKGIDEALKQLPEQTYPNTMKVTKPRKLRTWLYTAAAVGILSTGMIGSGFASPAMAAALSKVPGLNYIFSATYEDISQKEENPNVMYGSTYSYGEDGPYNLPIQETKVDTNYSEDIQKFIGMAVPKVPSAEVTMVRADKYSKGQVEVTSFNHIHNGEHNVVLSVVPNAMNLPQFDGYSVSPIIKEKVNINGVEAEVVSYSFSETDKTNITNYVAWKRNDFNLVLSSTVNLDELIEISREVDKQVR